MLPQLKAINVLNHAVFAFVVILVTGLKFSQNFDFYVCVVDIKLFIFRNFCSNNGPTWILAIYTFDNLTEGTSVYDLYNFIPPGQLFTLLHHVEPLFVGNRILILSTNLSNCVDSFIHTHFHFFKFCELISEKFNRFMRWVSILHLRRHVGSHCTLRAWCFRFSWLSAPSKFLLL